jgi:DNA-binding GntR family transcriptional regulator
MRASVRYLAAAPRGDLAELRLLIELPALRRLADRGLSDQELTLVKGLADATMRAARSRDVPGYLLADMVFHLCLLDLTGDPALSDVARLLLAPDRLGPSHPERSDSLMAREAREHGELVEMFADGMVSAADQLMRQHLSRLRAGRPVPARIAEPDPSGAAGA